MSPHVRRLVNELDERLRAEQGTKEPPALRLAFDGALSDGELRILEQGALEDRA